MRVAVYAARFSSDLQRMTSLEDQIATAAATPETLVAVHGTVDGLPRRTAPSDCPLFRFARRIGFVARCVFRRYSIRMSSRVTVLDRDRTCSERILARGLGHVPNLGSDIQLVFQSCSRQGRALVP
jgi:hypothetical protein